MKLLKIAHILGAAVCALFGLVMVVSAFVIRSLMFGMAGLCWVGVAAVVLAMGSYYDRHGYRIGARVPGLLGGVGVVLIVTSALLMANANV